MTRKVNIAEAKARLSELVAAAAAGEEIVLARHGKPVARLAPLEAAPRHVPFGIWKGRGIRLSPDFDAPLPEFESDFYGNPAAPAAPHARRRARRD